MKLHILNDLHIEFSHFDIPRTDADVIILAGDIGVGMGGMEWLQQQDVTCPVIYVPGNHEFYQHDINLVEELKTRAPSHVFVLDNDMVIIDGVRFLGSVLWSDFALYGEAERVFSMRYAGSNMSDFSLIKKGEEIFSPKDSIYLHQYSRDWLSCMLAEPYAGSTVVVTHHAPSEKSVHQRYKNHILSPAFASDLEQMMEGERVALWVHGHTHDAFDYDVHGTRVICNPRGYQPFESATGFKQELLVEIAVE